jgi:hypothetical protein
MPIRKRIPTILIVCEGKKTEKIYFENFKKRGKGLIVKIAKNEKTNPVGIVEHAKTLITTEYNIDARFGDQVWCVFDADSNTDQEIQKAKKLAGKNINVCLSNPSFEIWYLLHFEYLEHPINNPDLIKRLNQFISGYEKNKCCYRQILDNQGRAIDYAKQLSSFHLNQGRELHCQQSNPLTEVYKLIEIIK